MPISTRQKSRSTRCAREARKHSCFLERPECARRERAPTTARLTRPRRTRGSVKLIDNGWLGRRVDGAHDDDGGELPAVDGPYGANHLIEGSACVVLMSYGGSGQVGRLEEALSDTDWESVRHQSETTRGDLSSAGSPHAKDVSASARILVPRSKSCVPMRASGMIAGLRRRRVQSLPSEPGCNACCGID